MAPLVRRLARHAWRGVVLVIGLVLVGAGLVMMVTPGPGIAAVLAGLALLATEFAWARKVLAYVRRRFDAARDQVRRRAPGRLGQRARGAQERGPGPGTRPPSRAER